MTAKKGSANGAVVVDAGKDDTVLVDLSDLSSGEIDLAEELSECPISDLFNPDRRKGKLTIALGCVLRRRTDPGFTMEAAAHLKVFMMDSKPVPPIGGRASSTRSRSPRTSA